MKDLSGLQFVILTAWDQSYRVHRTGAMMFGAVSSSTLHAFRDLVALYVQRYGPETWVFLYKADVRARPGHVGRMRRRALTTDALGSKPAQP